MSEGKQKSCESSNACSEGIVTRAWGIAYKTVLEANDMYPHARHHVKAQKIHEAIEYNKKILDEASKILRKRKLDKNFLEEAYAKSQEKSSINVPREVESKSEASVNEVSKKKRPRIRIVFGGKTVYAPRVDEIEGCDSN